MTDRGVVIFCPKCGLQTPAHGKSTASNGCCEANRIRVFADSITVNDRNEWTYEPAGKERKMGRQQQIKGTERKRNPKLAAAMEKYVELRDKSIQAGNRASVAKEELLELAVKHKEELVQVDDEFVFVDDDTGYELIFTDKANVKVRKHKDDQAADVSDG